MRIQRRDANPGVLESPLPEALVGEAQVIQDAVLLHVVAGHPQRAVRTQVDHTQVFGHQHGCNRLGAGQLLQQFHVADGFVAGHGRRLFVQRRGCQSINDARHCELASLADPFHRCFTAGDAELAN